MTTSRGGELKIELGRRYRFAASHRLHSAQMSDAENARIYGKCNNACGHGHNYVVEVSISGEIDPATGMIANLADLDEFVAREVIVGTLGTLYGADPATQSLSLQAALRHDLTLGGAMALVVFFAFAMQCTSTLAIVRRETNSWKWPALQFAYMSVLAYVAALATNVLISRFF